MKIGKGLGKPLNIVFYFLCIFCDLSPSSRSLSYEGDLFGFCRVILIPDKYET